MKLASCLASRMAASLAALMMALPAFADVVIRTRDGAVHRVPVAPQDVTGIEFVPGVGAGVAPVVQGQPFDGRLGMPWVVNSNGNIFRPDTRGWQQLSGAAQDIGVGADGSVWVVGTNSVPGGFGLWRWTGSEWAAIDGGATRIAVGPRGEPWVVNAEGRIFARRANGWRELPGRASDIGVGANGEVWVIGTDASAGGFSIQRWTGNEWDRVDGAAVRIAVGPDGNPWVVNSEGRIYQRQRGAWVEMPGRARDIGVSANGTPWVIGIDNVAGGGSIFYWSGGNWVRVDGAAVAIAVR